MLPYLGGYGSPYSVTVPVRYSHLHYHMPYGEACYRSIRNSTQREIGEKKRRANHEMRWEMVICRYGMIGSIQSSRVHDGRR